ncbi:MAG: polysaccharide biosynthesis protein [Salinarimonadaceae bacterium]|nr:MAG: polysaccharide biosynthesis protein [Salinarimonadaceae bacterium]
MPARLSWKQIFASAHDVFMAAAAMVIALSSRYGFESTFDQNYAWAWVLGFAGIAAIVFRLFGLGRGMWRFASITDLRSIVLASTVTILLFLIVLFLVNRLEGLPRATPLIAWFVMIVLLGAPRLAYRALKDGGLSSVRPRDLHEPGCENIILIGTAAEADLVIRSYGLERSRRYKVHGIVDYTEKKRGRDVRGFPIIGDLSELPSVLERLSRGGVTIDAAIVAPSESKLERGQELAAIAARTGLPLRRVTSKPLTSDEPDLAALTLEDLLGRAPVRLDLDNIRALVEGRVVLVTGAGGSIGSELVRQIARRGPARLILIDASEYALYQIDQTLSREFPALARRALIADVRDGLRVKAIMGEERPAVVFHAAALKHVPLVEHNVREGVLTNIVGTRIMADAAVEAGAEAFVLISTDKAIRPTSVMGATKRAAEAYCQALDVSGVATRLITVRFGNVLGSTGSVVPLFRAQIEAGGPVTVTDPDMRRYFMTIAEATELVLQAAARGIERPDQRGRICVLDMGEPVRIVDLARTMIALAGLRPEIDIPIAFTGLRPGEKLFEELFEEGETTVPSGADGVFVATARLFPLEEVRETFDRLEQAARADEAGEVRALLARITPSIAEPGQEPAAEPSTAQRLAAPVAVTTAVPDAATEAPATATR